MRIKFPAANARDIRRRSAAVLSTKQIDGQVALAKKYSTSFHFYPKKILPVGLFVYQPRMLARISTCSECAYFIDEIETGAPTRNPCGLDRRLSICAWRKLILRDGAPPSIDCNWHTA